MLAAIVAAVAGPVELRGGQTVSAPVEEVSVVGVRVGGDEPRVIAWDSVRKVTGDKAGAAAGFAETAEIAWRARLRLARGDAALAGPMFERLWETYKDVSGPTALMVSEGTVACRLASGRGAEAIAPWVHAVSLREAGVVIAGDPPLEPVLDAELMVVPSLPPIWLDARSAADAMADAPISAPGIAGDFASLYARAAVQQGADGVAPPMPDREHPGVSFVRMIVECGAPDAGRREAARYALLGKIDAATGTWREAWMRAAIGRSYLMEDDPRQRMVGVFNLMHLPARFAWTTPDLAAMGLALSAKELAAQGDLEGAGSIRAELERMFPGAREIAWLDANSPVRVQPRFTPGVDPIPTTPTGTIDDPGDEDE